MRLQRSWLQKAILFFFFTTPSITLKAGSLDEANQIRAQVQRAIHFVSGQSGQARASILEEIISFVEFQDWADFNGALLERLYDSIANKEAARLSGLSFLLRVDRAAAPDKQQQLIRLFIQICQLQEDDPQNRELFLAMATLSQVLREGSDHHFLLEKFKELHLHGNSEALLGYWIIHFASLEALRLEMAHRFEDLIGQLSPEHQLVLVKNFHRWKAPKQIRPGLYRLLDNPETSKPLREAAKKALIFTFGGTIPSGGARDMARHPYDSPLQPLRSLTAKAQASFSASCLKPLRSLRAAQAKALKKP